MKYFVHYVEDSTPKLARFKTAKEAKKFINDFRTDLENGYWIDFLIYGKLTIIDSYYDMEK